VRTLSPYQRFVGRSIKAARAGSAPAARRELVRAAGRWSGRGRRRNPSSGEWRTAAFAVGLAVVAAAMMRGRTPAAPAGPVLVVGDTTPEPSSGLAL
jgi:hypothetical protein